MDSGGGEKVDDWVMIDGWLLLVVCFLVIELLIVVCCWLFAGLFVSCLFLLVIHNYFVVCCFFVFFLVFHMLVACGTPSSWVERRIPTRKPVTSEIQPDWVSTTRSSATRTPPFLKRNDRLWLVGWLVGCSWLVSCCCCCCFVVVVVVVIVVGGGWFRFFRWLRSGDLKSNSFFKAGACAFPRDVGSHVSSQHNRRTPYEHCCTI